MDRKVRDFVRLYNRNMEWNKDIFSELERKYISNSEYVNLISSGHVSFRKISRRICDLENAKVYEYEDTGMLELQAYCYDTYGIRYYWANPNLDKDTYKKKKIEDIEKLIGEYKQKATKKLEEATAEINEINKVLEFIKLKK